jgi:hypothetical protein
VGQRIQGLHTEVYVVEVSESDYSRLKQAEGGGKIKVKMVMAICIFSNWIRNGLNDGFFISSTRWLVSR